MNMLTRVLSIILSCSVTLSAETSILSTTYPSPSGIYKTLSTTQRTLLAINSGQNVGIGTTNPTNKLHLYGGGALFEMPAASPTNIQLKTNNTAMTKGIQFANGAFIEQSLLAYGTTYPAPYTGGIALNVIGAAPIFFVTNSVRRMVIDSAGRVGIGTDGPNSLLTVAANVNNAQGYEIKNNNAGSNATAGIFLRDYNGFSSGMAVYNNNATGSRTNTMDIFNNKGAGVGNIAFWTGITEKMRITGSGNVGIGITAPTAKLHVNGNIIATGNVDMGQNLVATTCNGTDNCTTTCPAGSKILTGGCLSNAAPLRVNFPWNFTTWACYTTAVTGTLQAWAICARVD